MLDPTQHPNRIHFHGEKAQQWFYTGCALQTVLPDILILQISSVNTIFPSAHVNCCVF